LYREIKVIETRYTWRTHRLVHSDM